MTSQPRSLYAEHKDQLAERYGQALEAYNEYLTSHPGYSGTVELVQLERQMKQARRQWVDANR